MQAEFATYLFIALMLATAVLAGVELERFRARRAWRARKRGKTHTLKVVRPAVNVGASLPARPDATEQLRAVMRANFQTRALLSQSEARILQAAEAEIAARGLSWRVMAQVCLGEILASPNTQAYAAINSKRVDLLVIDAARQPIAAIEYQGRGHYQGTAPARDAVKKEALRRAGVRFIELTHEHRPRDLAQEIERLAKAVGVQPAPASARPAAI